MNDEATHTTTAEVDAFVERWEKAQGSERSNGQSFVRELAALVGAGAPGVATGDPAADDYVFERPVRFVDGPQQTVGFADLYRRGAVMLETKQGVDAERAAQGKRQRKGHGVRGTAAWEATMVAAKNQAARYARNLEPSEPAVPFLAVVDVGYCVDLFADFGGSGRLYTPFPSPEGYRIRLEDLTDADVRERVRRVFEDPTSLDPARYQAAVTRALADYIVGNPPFVGKGAPMRESLGQDGLDALAAAYPDVPGSVDLVMYWWDRAAEAVREGRVRRFGLITTSSITQTFNRRIVERHLGADSEPLALAFAVPNHPWVDDGADVRMAVTVGVRASAFDAEAGRLATVASEDVTADGVPEVELAEAVGTVHADLTVGADVSAAEPLEANAAVSSFGVLLAGRGFVVSPSEASALGLGTEEETARVIRPVLNGRDLTSKPRDRFVIDFFGLDAEEARAKHPAIYEHVVREVKPDREKSTSKSKREKWWLFDRSRPTIREALAGLRRFLVTPETTKHRLFQFLPAEALPEHGVIIIALDDGYHLGVLSSRVHGTWAVAGGGKLGIGNDPRYNTTKTFQTYPFPAAKDEPIQNVRRLGGAIDTHRKARQAAHPGLGLTDLYNAVEALRAGRALTEREQRDVDAGLAHTLADLHRQLDRAVLEAYGWGDLDAESTGFGPKVLERLVALNAARAEEERQGRVRYLRPSFQDPGGSSQAGLALPTVEVAQAEAAEPRPWPEGMAAQTVAVRRAVSALGSADAAAVAARFRGVGARTVAPVLETLAELGLVRAEGGVFVA